MIRHQAPVRGSEGTLEKSGSVMTQIHTPPGEVPVPGPAYLAATHYFDTGHPLIRAFVDKAIAGETTDIGRAIKLFYAVRDGWRYDPFSILSSSDSYIASNILQRNVGYCVPKGVLLTTLARAAGIQAAIGLSDVKNHLTTDKLKERMGGSTTFMHHGYAVLYLEGRWVKAAPAFNIELCDRFGVRPTEFDGHSDAVFQEYDNQDRRHMEYVKDHGCWSELPFEKIMADFKSFYPLSLFADIGGEEKERFEDGAPARKDGARAA